MYALAQRLLFIALLAVAQEARADEMDENRILSLAICNFVSDEAVSAAIVAHPNTPERSSDWILTGWYSLEPQECTTIDVSRGYTFLLLTNDGGRSNLLLEEGGSTVDFCVDPDIAIFEREIEFTLGCEEGEILVPFTSYFHGEEGTIYLEM